MPTYSRVKQIASLTSPLAKENRPFHFLANFLCIALAC